MKTLLTRARPNAATITVVAVLSLAGIATANQAIRDNTINTRDIKNNQVNTRDLRNNTITTRDVRDNQVNTRDLRDDALRGADVHDGSLGIEDLSAEVLSYAGTATLLDPRAHDQDSDGNGNIDDPAGTVPGHVCCLSWNQGPVEVEQVAALSADPIPAVTAGRQWRSVTLDPGSYVLQSTGYAQKSAAASVGTASRLFLGGKPMPGVGYAVYPAGESPLPTSHSYTTAFEVGAGTSADRQLTQRVVSVEGKATFTDNLLIWEVTPR